MGRWASGESALACFSASRLPQPLEELLLGVLERLDASRRQRLAVEVSTTGGFFAFSASSLPSAPVACLQRHSLPSAPHKPLRLVGPPVLCAVM